MNETNTVALHDGTKAQLKAVQVSSWQTVMIAVAPPESKSARPGNR
ncbi:MAG: hypothetical protein ACO1OB_01855 [Archangium sp.]